MGMKGVCYNNVSQLYDIIPIAMPKIRVIYHQTLSLIFYWLTTWLGPPSILLKANNCRLPDLQEDSYSIIKVTHFLSIDPIFES